MTWRWWWDWLNDVTVVTGLITWCDSSIQNTQSAACTSSIQNTQLAARTSIIQNTEFVARNFFCLFQKKIASVVSGDFFVAYISILLPIYRFCRLPASCHRLWGDTHHPPLLNRYYRPPRAPDIGTHQVMRCLCQVHPRSPFKGLGPPKGSWKVFKLQMCNF